MQEWWFHFKFCQQKSYAFWLSELLPNFCAWTTRERAKDWNTFSVSVADSGKIPM